MFDPKPRKDFGFNLGSFHCFNMGSFKKEASGMEHGTQFSLATFNSTHPPNRSTGSNSIEAQRTSVATFCSSRALGFT